MKTDMNGSATEALKGKFISWNKKAFNMVAVINNYMNCTGGLFETSVILSIIYELHKNRYTLKELLFYTDTRNL